MSDKPSYERYESHEIYGFSRPRRLVLTCEHASARVPAPLRSTETDRSLLKTHWGWDIGARSISREIIRATHSIGVFTRFSRLICDANRTPDHPNLIRCAVDGQVLSFNEGLTIEEVDRRLLTYHAPYHAAVDNTIGTRLMRPGPVMLLAIHSFTPEFQGERRTMDIGVLFDPFEPIAHRLRDRLAEEGLTVALNAPYSGRGGLMYTATRHGSCHGIVHMEVEVNQQHARTAAAARKIGRTLASAFNRLHWRV